MSMLGEHRGLPVCLGFRKQRQGSFRVSWLAKSPSFLSVAAIKQPDEKQHRRELISLTVPAGKSRWQGLKQLVCPGQGSRKESAHPLVCLLCSVQLFYADTLQDPRRRNGAIHSGLSLPPSISLLERIPYKQAHKPINGGNPSLRLVSQVFLGCVQLTIKS